MNTQSNAVPESFQAQKLASERLSMTRPMYWSVRRELWENRSLYIAPLAAAAVYLLGFLVGSFRLPGKMRAALLLDPMRQRQALAIPYDLAAYLLMGTTLIVGIFYCLDALYGERRDRSILFWKSLPVSDVAVVLSKAAIPLILLPLLTFGVTIALQFVMLLVHSLVLLGSGLSPTTLWPELSFPRMSAVLLYHLIAVHGLWYAPFFGWFLLASAWARRAPFLWAILPPFAIGVVEKIAFNTAHFAYVLQNRFMGGSDAVIMGSGDDVLHPMTHLTIGRFLLNPDLWLGFLFTAICLVLAVRLRRYRSPN